MSAVRAQSSPAVFTPTIEVPHVASAPPIDGSLSSPAWKQAAKVELRYNLRDHQFASVPTTAYVMTDSGNLYVGFDVKTRGALQSTQHTNDVGQGTDDQVAVYLWPNGANGYNYGFLSNPVGTHYEFSSENNNYAPTWFSAGKIVPGGYTVTMKIPLNVMRGGSDKPWRVEFARQNPNTLDDFVWAYGSVQQQGQDDNVVYSGYMTGMAVRAAATRPKPRLGVYALGALAGKSAGGSTSRAGLDLSVPVTPSAAFIATIHPDYSNVELDQQTIAPTAFRRFFSEVLPFFAQGSSFYNNFTSFSTQSVEELYTPSIPTPRDGYAVEGKQGLLSFAAFDAVGIARDDSAQTVSFASKDQRNAVSVQRTAVDMPQFKDDTIVYGARHDSLKGLLEYANIGEESGTAVTDASQARRAEAGVNVYDQNAYANLAITKIGAQYSPFDGFVSLPDVAGYNLAVGKTWYYKPGSRFPRFIFSASVDRFHNSAGALDLTDNSVAIGWDMQNILGTKQLWHAYAQTGSSFLRLPNGIFTPITQNGFRLYYDYRTDTPAFVTFSTGRYGAGRLDSWTRGASLKTGRRGLFTLEADDTIHRLDSGISYVQWLERACFTFQNGPDSSFALGIRRIIGTDPALYGPPEFASGWNLSAAYHKRLPHDELYLVYGDASALSTTPELIAKLIHYFGAEKGT